MGTRGTTTKARLTIALGLMYKEISDMPAFDSGRESLAEVKREGLRTVRLLLNSDEFLARLAAKMDEVS